MEAFLHQNEAWSFVRSIPEPKERLLTELALAKALSFLAADSSYRETFSVSPMDLLTLARTLREFFKDTSVISGVLNGSIASVDDLDPFKEA